MSTEQNLQPAQPKMYLISEDRAQALLQGLSKLSWAQADPLIKFFRESLSEVPEQKQEQSQENQQS
jgi:hypothetical protein